MGISGLMAYPSPRMDTAHAHICSFTGNVLWGASWNSLDCEGKQIASLTLFSEDLKRCGLIEVKILLSRNMLSKAQQIIIMDYSRTIKICEVEEYILA